MTMSLTVASSLDRLTEVLAERLLDVPTDPFASELVAVPGDGVRTWLVAALARRLGAPTGSGAGIVANVDFVFPGQLVRRALGEAGSSGPWSIGPLTWAIHEAVHRYPDEVGLPVDAVRARSIADLFDRYALHRPEMVRGWELGRDVDAMGQPLAPHLRWQPVLWRRVVALTGGSSAAAALARAVDELRNGDRVPEVPARAFLFGLASLPGPHLDVLAALATRRSVEVLAPATSITAWRRLHDGVRAPLARPILRATDPTVDASTHPLASGWDRSAREAHVLILDAARRAGADIRAVDGGRVDEPVQSEALLTLLQHAIRADIAPVGPPLEGSFDFRPELDAGDRSVQWHTCHGLARQVEVLRDVIVRLLEAPASTVSDGGEESGRRLELRDIVILCPDVVAAAPIADAVFAGDPERGLPSLPLRVADRSLRQDNPVLDAVAALLELLDGRFRASDVLAFVSRGPVRRRFGLAPDDLGRLAGWAEQLNVRWGLDTAGRSSFGLPTDLAAHTWQAGLDQLLLGGVMADLGERMGPGITVPFGDIEGDAVDLAGTLAEVVHHLGVAHRELSGAQPVAPWCTAVRRAAMALLAVSDADSWQWRDLEAELTQMTDDSAQTWVPEPDGPAVVRRVPATELATLLGMRLGGRPGRVQFGTGAITLSSLTAQRGVPHRVVCLLGVDGDLGGGSRLGADDLTVGVPCVGDRDLRSETRAQLLDAILSAGDHLVICSSGRDIRSNAVLAPAVPLAELADLIDLTARPPAGTTGTASRFVTVDHPRHAWSDVNFVADALGVDGAWSFDTGAQQAAARRRAQGPRPAFLERPLPSDVPGDVDLEDLLTAISNPVRTLLQDRLGLWLEREVDPRDDLVPLGAAGLDGWRIKQRLLLARLDLPGTWTPGAAAQWEAVQRASGAVPPLSFGDGAIAAANGDVESLLAATLEIVGTTLHVAPVSRHVDIDLGGGRRLIDEVAGIRGHIVVDVSPTKLRPKHTLGAWLRIAALTCMYPELPWETIVVGRGPSSAPLVIHLSMRSVDDARAAVTLADDLYRRARQRLVPALARTTFALHTEGPHAAAKEWQGHDRFSEGRDDWAQFALGTVDLDELLLQPPADDEQGPGWGDAPSSLERWAHRIWQTLADTTVRGTAGDEDATPSNGVPYGRRAGTG